MTLYHVSEDAEIQVFAPRLTEGRAEPLVWAIDETHLPNYLLPRECPRVCFRRSSRSSADDISRLIGVDDVSHVIVIERVWLDRCRHAHIIIYEFDADPFQVDDEEAGYYVACCPIHPKAKRLAQRPLDEIVARGVSIRVTDDLWEVRDEVVNSSLQFSCIRMRNADKRHGELGAVDNIDGA
jgi:hypothetical protein